MFEKYFILNDLFACFLSAGQCDSILETDLRINTNRTYYSVILFHENTPPPLQTHTDALGQIDFLSGSPEKIEQAIVMHYEILSLPSLMKSKCTIN